MSRFTKYSRWPIAAILAVWGLRELFLPGSESGIEYRILGASFFIVPAVGIVLLQRWVYGVAIAVSSFNAAQAIFGPFGPASTFGKSAMVVTLVLVLVWLMLPNVRHQFLKQDASV
jgi:preprotein translocase subunit SecG